MIIQEISIQFSLQLSRDYTGPVNESTHKVKLVHIYIYDIIAL